MILQQHLNSLNPKPKMSLHAYFPADPLHWEAVQCAVCTSLVMFPDPLGKWLSSQSGNLTSTSPTIVVWRSSWLSAISSALQSACSARLNCPKELSWGVGCRPGELCWTGGCKPVVGSQPRPRPTFEPASVAAAASTEWREPASCEPFQIALRW